jgi:small subunit ribosomal protein S4
MGYSKKVTERNSKDMRRRKQSEYGLQLNEKQKVKFIYGVLEKQFRSYYEKAAAADGITGEVLLSTLARRLDSVVFRMGFAMTRREARQLVNHGHFTVNGKKVNIPSYLIKAGDVVQVKESSRSSVKFKRFLGEDAIMATLPGWIDRPVKDDLKVNIVRLPERADIDFPVEEHLIVELYSK